MHIIPQTTRRQPRLLFLCVFLLGAHVASGIAQAGRESDSNEDIFVGPNNDDDHQHDPLDLGDGARYNYCEADHPIAGRHPSPRVNEHRWHPLGTIIWVFSTGSKSLSTHSPCSSSLSICTGVWIVRLQTRSSWTCNCLPDMATGMK